MRPLALPRLLTFSFPSQCSLRSKSRLKSPGFSVLSSPIQSQATKATNTDLKSEYKPGIFDNLFLALFRNKMVQEVGWDSEKPGYDGLIEVANRLMMNGRSNAETAEAAVFVERCKYLEESKCIGICINTCKLPTQAFFKDYMGVPLLMEPNFSDYSCQFKFGVSPPLPTEDKTLKEPCLDICPNATRRRQILEKCETVQCPKV